MKIVRHAKLIARRRRQAMLLSFGGLAVLGLGLFLNFKATPLAAYAALVIGSVASWIGIAVADKWIRPPRDDLGVDEVLRGSGQAFALYHWVLPAEHVLVAPWGVTTIVVSKVDGAVRVEGERWTHRRPLLRRLLTLGRRPLGNPGRLADLEARALVEALAEDGTCADVPVDAVVVFTDPELELTVAGSHVAVCAVAGLRDWVKEARKRPRIAAADRRALDLALDRLAEATLRAGDKPAKAPAERPPG